MGWQSVGVENLMRHDSGTYYLSATVRRKKILRSLKTKSLKIAKAKRDALLAEIRSLSVAEPSHIKTVSDALGLVLARMLANPRSKPRTLEHHKEIEATLRKTLPVERAGSEWTKDEALRWWSSYAGSKAASQANKGLSMAKKLAAVLIEAGLRFDDPTKGLRRMSVPASAVHGLPSMAKVLEAIQSIRDQRKRVSGESADMAEFMLRSGFRRQEAQGLRGGDIGEHWITAHGKTGSRKVPISPSLEALIVRRKWRRIDGPVFQIKTPRLALSAACKRIGIPHLRIHDLRHLFATNAIEAGVDVPTVAKWLGHKDGGALAMRTYGHIRDDHSLEQARKLK